jgi:N-acetylglutamate synthase-like GNAT family acetyltransferase
LPALVLLAAAAADRLAPVARDLGLQPVGSLPLMVHEPQEPVADAETTGRYQVERVTTVEDLAVVHRLLADAFGLPLVSIARAFGSQMLAVTDLAVFLTRHAGQPVSTAMTTTSGNVVGIWSMATPPAHQRQGAGRATLAAVLADHQQHGADRFYLGATAAGKPLYESVGFRTIEETPIWVAGQSAQFPGH